MANNGVSFVLQSLNRLLEQDTDLLNPKLKWRINQIRSLGIPSQTDHFHLNTTRIEKKSNDAGGTCMHVVTLARSTIHEAASRNSSISLATMLVILFCQKQKYGHKRKRRHIQLELHYRSQRKIYLCRRSTFMYILIKVALQLKIKHGCHSP